MMQSYNLEASFRQLASLSLYEAGKGSSMIPIRSQRDLGGFMLRLGMGSVAGFIFISALSVWSAQNPALPKTNETAPAPSEVHNPAAVGSPKQNEDGEKSNHENAKADAAELSALADQLHDELKKMNKNVFSLAVVKKTEEIERLAKKIKGEANAH